LNQRHCSVEKTKAFKNLHILKTPEKETVLPWIPSEDTKQEAFQNYHYKPENLKKVKLEFKFKKLVLKSQRRTKSESSNNLRSSEKKEELSQETLPKLKVEPTFQKEKPKESQISSLKKKVSNLFLLGVVGTEEKKKSPRLDKDLKKSPRLGDKLTNDATSTLQRKASFDSLRKNHLLNSQK
jgi:hypothetical protein